MLQDYDKIMYRARKKMQEAQRDLLEGYLLRIKEEYLTFGLK